MEDLFSFVRELYDSEFVPLHEPVFIGNENKYVSDCIKTTFVSSVGRYVDLFENMVADVTGAKHAVAVANGTCGLQIALQCLGVEQGDEVITQSLTFVGTANAISHSGATPIFLDVDRDTLGLCPKALDKWLSGNVSDGLNINTKRPVKAVMPVHVFGNPCLIDDIKYITEKYGMALVEDAAESLGSFRNGKHTGTFGDAGVFSFNGNKIVTSGGGGCIVTNDSELARRMKHITTTAKKPHPYEFFHDEIGYNYRLTNLAAALGCAQLENLKGFIEIKQSIANKYEEFFQNKKEHRFIKCPDNCERNNWLNAFVVQDKIERDKILEAANNKGIQFRPIWTLMTDLPMYQNCQRDDLLNSIDFVNTVINLPSSANAKV